MCLPCQYDEPANTNRLLCSRLSRLGCLWVVAYPAEPAAPHQGRSYTQERLHGHLGRDASTFGAPVCLRVSARASHACRQNAVRTQAVLSRSTCISVVNLETGTEKCQFHTAGAEPLPTRSIPSTIRWQACVAYCCMQIHAPRSSFAGRAVSPKPTNADGPAASEEHTSPWSAGTSGKLQVRTPGSPACTPKSNTSCAHPSHASASERTPPTALRHDVGV
jgi:hypothetical protein